MIFLKRRKPSTCLSEMAFLVTNMSCTISASDTHSDGIDWKLQAKIGYSFASNFLPSGKPMTLGKWLKTSH